MQFKILLICLLCASPLLGSGLDLSNPEDYLQAFLRVRGDASGKEVVYHWTGQVYSIIPGEKSMQLFDFEGYSIARSIVEEGGFKLLTREAAFFKDHRTGKILESWRNPFTGHTIPVVHIFNDPVNQDMSISKEYLPYIHQIIPSTDLGETLVFYMDIFPFYPSPLNTREHGEYVGSDMYQAGEFFQFFVDKNDLANEEMDSVPANISWNRISPWMPFMRMADRAGNLFFVCRGRKLEGGFESLPDQIRTYILDHKPEFASAPAEWSEPNETSWSYFRKLLEQNQEERGE
ncbi:MAG: DUF1838 family protein [Candidatus Cloacimonetes bacterium]|nr:DUF1838 family protein [Candidatus Cloacimonadota bacterium]